MMALLGQQVEIEEQQEDLEQVVVRKQLDLLLVELYHLFQQPQKNRMDLLGQQVEI
jgi:hypothetical protein